MRVEWRKASTADEKIAIMEKKSLARRKGQFVVIVVVVVVVVFGLCFSQRR